MSAATPMVITILIVPGSATARAARATVLTKIWGIHNILKL